MDYEYLAGFFDGEGCVSIQRQGNYYSLRTVVTNTVAQPLELFQKEFGGRIDTKIYTNGWQPLYRWWLSSNKAATFLREIQPFLLVKKEPARIGISLQDSINEYNKVRIQGIPLPTDQMEYREELRLLLQRFNSKKGTRA